MKEISLTQGKFALVDDEDFEYLNQFKWHVAKSGQTFYVTRTSPPTNDGKRHTIYMHKEILHTPKGMDTDHINGNALDNRRENIRICSHRDNLQNLHKPKTSRFVGVNWDTRKRKWRVRLKFHGKNRSFGSYHEEETASTVYTVAYAVLVKGE